MPQDFFDQYRQPQSPQQPQQSQQSGEDFFAKYRQSAPTQPSTWDTVKNAAGRFIDPIWQAWNPVNWAQAIVNPNTYKGLANESYKLVGGLTNPMVMQESIQNIANRDSATPLAKAILRETPFFGPQLGQAYDKFADGNLAGGAGELTSVATQISPEGTFGNIPGMSKVVEAAQAAGRTLPRAIAGTPLTSMKRLNKVFGKDSMGETVLNERIRDPYNVQPRLNSLEGELQTGMKNIPPFDPKGLTYAPDLQSGIDAQVFQRGKLQVRDISQLDDTAKLDELNGKFDSANSQPGSGAPMTYSSPELLEFSRKQGEQARRWSADSTTPDQIKEFYYQSGHNIAKDKVGAAYDEFNPGQQSFQSIMDRKHNLLGVKAAADEVAAKGAGGRTALETAILAGAYMGDHTPLGLATSGLIELTRNPRVGANVGLAVHDIGTLATSPAGLKLNSLIAQQGYEQDSGDGWAQQFGNMYKLGR